MILSSINQCLCEKSFVSESYLVEESVPSQYKHQIKSLKYMYACSGLVQSNVYVIYPDKLFDWFLHKNFYYYTLMHTLTEIQPCRNVHVQDILVC